MKHPTQQRKIRLFSEIIVIILIYVTGSKRKIRLFNEIIIIIIMLIFLYCRKTKSILLYLKEYLARERWKELSSGHAPQGCC